ncbi:hypothetical protein, partial [Streptosporangium roseum]|uniref:hypothetical protein n=1 Tax=Streptosporangium roseum TaxID=2001 RepID=UPI003334653D
EGHILHWSNWRRRHQARARQSHYLRRQPKNRDDNIPSLALRLLRMVAERQRWRATLLALEARASGQDLSAVREAA